MGARARTEREVKGLRREVPDDVGGVTTPERDKTLIPVCPGEAVHDALVGLGQTTLLDLHAQDMDVSIRRQAESDRDPTHHLILVLHQELDTLDGGGGGLGDGLRTHRSDVNEVRRGARDVYSRPRHRPS